MITDYIYEVINLFEFQNGFDITVNINMYLGVGLGSSASVSVSTLNAVSLYAGTKHAKDVIAGIARSIEIKIQGAASPIDTSMSTFGGIIDINQEFNLHNVDVNMNLPLIVQNCQISGNTGKLVESVRQKYEKYPSIIGKIFDAMEQIAVDAKIALEEGNIYHLANYMNINQGLLDSIGVNTLELSEMVYNIRLHGAKASKLTGSGGGGCIIAFCLDNIDKVYDSLDDKYPKFKCELSTDGACASIIEK
jgi:mevalonate kinase